MHTEGNFIVPLLPAVVDVDLQGLHRHHPEDSLDQVKDVEGWADEGDERDAYETAIEGEILEPVDELFLILTEPSVLGALVVEFADDEVGQKEDEGEGEEHERADEGEPLVVVQVLALEIGHPVELSLWGDYLLFIYRFCSKQKIGCYTISKIPYRNRNQPNGDSCSY